MLLLWIYIQRMELLNIMCELTARAHLWRANKFFNRRFLKVSTKCMDRISKLVFGKGLS